MGYEPKSDKTYNIVNDSTGRVTQITKKSITVAQDREFRNNYKNTHPDSHISSVSSKASKK